MAATGPVLIGSNRSGHNGRTQTPGCARNPGWLNLTSYTGEALIEKVRLATVDDANHDDVVMELVRLCGSTDVAG
jgi:hypothetical protein